MSTAVVFYLREAADELDALWDFEASLGHRDTRGSREYERTSNSVRLREIAEQLEDEGH